MSNVLHKETRLDATVIVDSVAFLDKFFRNFEKENLSLSKEGQANPFTIFRQLVYSKKFGYAFFTNRRKVCLGDVYKAWHFSLKDIIDRHSFDKFISDNSYSFIF